jgi:flavin reductase (DIM6/NTAB) family NADH-FMN oxidoreductase RutF
MTKQTFGPQPWLYPNPTVLVGTVVDGKPNVATYAWSGVTGGEPPTVSVGVRHSRYTLEGIRQNQAFSINIPSEDFVAQADYCGLVSGRERDKIADCGFTVTFGTTPGAPLIAECPVSLECEVLHLLNVGVHMLVVGKVVEAHVDSACLTDGLPDIEKIRPIIYSRGKAPRYNGVGKLIGTPFLAGLEIRNGLSKEGRA